MTPTKATTAKPAASPAAAKSGKVAKAAKGKPRNYQLSPGVYRFSRTKMFHKTARYKFIKKKTTPTPKPKKLTTKEKPIGGAQNGGKRLVLLRKRPKSYPTQDTVNKHFSKKTFREHKRFTRQSLRPGKVVILVAGPHKGKRVVLLKVLDSGLLLVTGPYAINGCPLRRVSQNYVIATRTKVKLPEDIVPATVNDAYFKRAKKIRVKNEDVFAVPKAKYAPSETRKSDQKTVDAAVLAAIKKRKDRSVFSKYLGSMFGLKKTQYPHRVKF